MIKCFFHSLFLADFPELLEKDDFFYWLEEGRLDGDFKLKEVIFCHGFFGEVYFDFLFGAFEGLVKRVDSYGFEKYFLIIVLNSCDGVNNSHGELPLTIDCEFNVIVVESVGNGGLSSLHI